MSQLKKMSLIIAASVGFLLLAGGLFYWHKQTVKEAVIRTKGHYMPRSYLQREIRHLHRELVSLRIRLEKQGEAVPLTRPPPPTLSEIEYATGEETLRSLNIIRQDLADLALAANGLKKRPEKPPASQQQRLIFKQSGPTDWIELPAAVENRSITLRNLGSEIIVNPRLIVNHQKNWFTLDTMLDEIIRDEMSDRERALALWRFVVDHRHHGEPMHKTFELHDPVRYLNLYGFGYCDDSAKTLAVMAEKAGLKARVWGLQGHVVTELYYDGSWHLFDPDGEVYYLADDGVTIAGLELLEQRPDLIRKQPGVYPDIEATVGYYTSTENNQLADAFRAEPAANHTMGYSLRPGESLTRSWDNKGLYFSSSRLQEPATYGNGRFVFEPVLQHQLYKKGAESATGLKLQSIDGAVGLTTNRNDQPGILSYRFDSPYPFLTATLRLKGRIADGGKISVEFSEDGEQWQLVRAFESSGEVKDNLSLHGYFRNGYGSPLFSYWIRLTLLSGRSAVTSLSSIRYSSDIQLAPHALPTLRQGSNSVRYQDDNRAGRAIEALFQYDPLNP